MINNHLEKINVVIYGGGAIGCHIAYCLFMSGNRVYLVCRGDHLKALKINGLSIKIKRNNHLLKESIITEQENFILINNGVDKFMTFSAFQISVIFFFKSFKINFIFGWSVASFNS